MKTPTYLFHADFPKGKVFDAAVENLDSLASKGWVDNPALIGAPAAPAAAQVAAAPASATETAPAAPTAGSGDKMAVFLADPKKLNKDELVELGKSLGIHPMMKGWKEETLIKKVQDHLNVNH